MSSSDGIISWGKGVLEVNVNTLEVKTLLEDKYDSRQQMLPGDHGKGGYAGQGRLVYSNNGIGGVLAQ
jgi:hypothetical protein